MEEIEFWKMNGSGNDFILIDNRKDIVPEEKMVDLVKGVCRRRESVGADGLILVNRSEECDFAWRFFNADGSEAEMCGNGGRCVARFAFLKGIAGRRMSFKTLAGIVSAEINGRIVKVLMPNLSGVRKDIEFPLKKGWESIDFINTGVPHVIVQVQNLEEVPVVEQGRIIRYHDMFSPEGTNANFIRVEGRDCIHIRTYERGVEDETLACGTGSMGAALAASARGMADSPVTVKTRGGDELRIYFEKHGDVFHNVWLEGSTSVSCRGFLHEEAFKDGCYPI
ncbi:MAG: diaminopimelate epimerase [Deltaproteobacteria bacterium]|nr:diaminopimelate epimerase [Deltaproteobacteria bacterium]